MFGSIIVERCPERATLLGYQRSVRYNEKWLATGTTERRGLIVVDVKKLAIVAGTLLVLFFVITQPGSSAALVHNILGMLRDAAESLITFVSNVFQA
ncbi:hypothetical protein GCM10025762_58610 [Haloechinothrix salitolerans]